MNSPHEQTTTAIPSAHPEHADRLSPMNPERLHSAKSPEPLLSPTNGPLLLSNPAVRLLAARSRTTIRLSGGPHYPPPTTHFAECDPLTPNGVAERRAEAAGRLPANLARAMPPTHRPLEPLVSCMHTPCLMLAATSCHCRPEEAALRWPLRSPQPTDRWSPRSRRCRAPHRQCGDRSPVHVPLTLSARPAACRISPST
jgi:hypothetical protein